MSFSCDTLVVGSGIAGLFTALEATRLGSVVLVTKAALEESNTRYAQGGIAAVMFEDDEVDLHVADTLAAGAGLCEEDAVRVLCSEGPDRIRDLLRIGVEFDRHGDGLARGLEAAHSRSRVLHAGGDATGARIESALAAAVRATGVTVLEHTFLTDLVVHNGAVTGARFLDENDAELMIDAGAVVLASGGAGQVYLHTTNPAVATGDGTAAAFRAGAAVTDAEFFQFHPTASALPGGFLISEAVRGEGAVLRDANGERFTEELAPRDVVARAIAAKMAEQLGEAVRLDATALGSEFLASRFPSIDAHVRANGVDWATQSVPVTPAAHYWMGGVRTDEWGRTTLRNLFAVGEVANTGVHGANRLASNSLLEGIVFGSRAISAIERHDTSPLSVDHASALGDFDEPASPFSREDLRRLMWSNAGLGRDRAGLRVAAKQLANWRAGGSGRAALEDANLAVVARLITEGALLREESRGGHYRNDHPTTSDGWRRRLTFVRG